MACATDATRKGIVRVIAPRAEPVKSMEEGTREGKTGRNVATLPRRPTSTSGVTRTFGLFAWYIIDSMEKGTEARTTFKEQWKTANECHVNHYDEKLGFDDILEKSNAVLCFVKRLQDPTMENFINAEGF